MKVIAKGPGEYPQGVRRRKNERFNWDDKDWERLKGLKKTPSWVVPEGQAGKAAPAADNPPAGAKGPKAPKAGKAAPAADNPPAGDQTGGSPALPGT